MTQSMIYVLVTGTNGGLGLGICTRLIDEFVSSYPSSCSLTLIFTTRSTTKGNETKQALETHCSTSHSSESRTRIHLQPENVELTNLLSIRNLCHKLLASKTPYLNALILNAGIGGWSDLNWPQAVGDIFVKGIVTNTTWPRFKLGMAGMITNRQFPERVDKQSPQEPPLGQIFCANLFGHYMLAHWLMPLLSACEVESPARIVWVSSIEATQKHFSEDDLQGLWSKSSYESGKRLTDILALTYHTKAAARSIAGFTSSETSHDDEVDRPKTSTPTMHVAHPGICITSIFQYSWIMRQLFLLTIYVARWIGSPWATISPYLAAASFSWLVLVSAEELDRKVKDNGGEAKWGTAVSRSGKPSVQPTDVQGWGINGTGDAFATTWWGGRYGRIPGSKDATEEEVQEFVAVGGRVWREMEELRMEWEGMIEEFDRANK